MQTRVCLSTSQSNNACFAIARAPRDADLAADFLASEVLVLEVALQDVLLCCQHDGGDPHPELLQNMLGSYHLQRHHFSALLLLLLCNKPGCMRRYADVLAACD